MLWWFVFLTSATVVLNHFAEGSHIQTYNFVKRATQKKIYHKSIDTFCFVALTKSVSQNIRGVTQRHCPSRILSQQESDTKRLQSIYFSYEVGIISSYSNTICYRKIAKSCTRDARELNAALRTVFDNHC